MTSTALKETQKKKTSISSKNNRDLEELILSKVQVLIKEEINKTIIAENKKEYDLLERMVRVEEGLKNVQQEMTFLRKDMDRRFGKVDKRIDSLSSTIKWFAGLGLTYITILMTILKYFG